jgi:hydrogenase expression/formation protein HypE
MTTTTAAQREDRVLERIDKFRQRRPRLLEEVVTLAHGAGGKSSAALVDAVFVEAFRNPELEQLGDAAVVTTPTGDRLAFSTDSYVVAPHR